MRRRYTKDYYQSRINIIKSKLPESSVGVDVIVGLNCLLKSKKKRN